MTTIDDILNRKLVISSYDISVDGLAVNCIDSSTIKPLTFLAPESCKSMLDSVLAAPAHQVKIIKQNTRYVIL